MHALSRMEPAAAPMTADSTTADSSEFDEGWECQRLAEVFDVSKERLREAVRKVGNNFDALAQELGRLRA